MKRGTVMQRHGRSCTRGARCGCRWSFCIDAPPGLDGRRRQILRGGFATKTEAREALGELQNRIAAGEHVGTSGSVGDFLDEWLAAKTAAGRRASTMAQYRTYVENYLRPALGHLRLADLRARHVDAMLARMAAEGRGLPTQHRVLKALSSALSMAQRRRLVSSNVCRQVELAPERTPERPVYDSKQLAAFLGAVSADRLRALWRLYALVGLRRGEALALTWATVDLDDGTIRVERSLGVVDGRLTFGPPKSESGVRTIAIDAETVRQLRSHRALQGSERLALGAAYREQDLAFCHQDGTPLRPEWVSARFQELAANGRAPQDPPPRPAALRCIHGADRWGAHEGGLRTPGALVAEHHCRRLLTRDARTSRESPRIGSQPPSIKASIKARCDQSVITAGELVTAYARIPCNSGTSLVGLPGFEPGTS